MKKFLCLFVACLSVWTMQAQTPQAEKLDRAPVAVKTSKGFLVSWRSLKSDATDLGFDVYRGGIKLNSAPITTKTNFLDDGGEAGATYTIKASNGEEFSVKAWDNMYKTIDVKRPSALKDASGSVTGRYRPDELSIGDIDGDGEFEMVIKWLPDNQRDSGKEGKASPTILTCNEMDGTQKWLINLGHNIRSGNHTMTFLVYDFDGDGKAEMICRTAAGSTDGTGKYVSEAGAADIKATDNSKTYQNSKGYVTGGEEFLTVFNGATGAAMQTIWYCPNRAGGENGGAATINGFWGDSYGGRAERFNAAVAYLDGLKPTAILQRGYYTQCYIWAVDWDGSNLKTRWLHKGTSKTAWSVVDAAGTELANETTNPVSSQGKSSYGQGVHGIVIADVNGDGFDDICTGGATIGHDGKLLCSTGFGHGDAIHVGDLVPDRPGLELMMPHEESPFGYDVHDATTGEVLVSAQYPNGGDNGRGLACDFIPSHKGSEFWSSCPTLVENKTTKEKDEQIYPCEGGAALNAKRPDTNFRIYWTGDPFDQTFDGRYDSNTGISSPRIQAWNTASKKITTVQEFADFGQPQTSNTTKATPCLQADFLGDWREELIMWQYESDWSSPTCKLMVFSTPQETEYKVPCLLQDHQYRMAIAWQNASYNQPPHLSYSLAESLGIDRASYQTNLTSTAPEATPIEPSKTGTEEIKTPGADKEAVSGLSYTAGANGELTNTAGKIRTGNNDQIVITVNEGYVITGITISGHSNNSSALADRSITLTGIYIDDDGTSVLTSPVVFPGGTAGTSDVEGEASGFRAGKQIVLTFDNSLISTYDKALPVSVDNDDKGKNKQLASAKITVTYEKVETGIQSVQASKQAVDAIYNLQGIRVKTPTKGIYIINGKKVLK